MTRTLMASGRIPMRGFGRRLAGDSKAVTALEFGLVAPVFLTFLIGIFDLGQMAYGNSVLQGAVQQAARSSALETADTAAADAMVSNIILPVLPAATLSTSRTSYFDFADIARAERFNDGNNNSVCDNGESYVDENENGEWDPDIGLTGNGGASDVVVYTVTASYDPVFKVPFLPEQWNTRTLTASAIKKNQPFGSQNAYGSVSGTCDD